MERNNDFRIIYGKGFHLPVGNYYISVQFGYGNYCENYNKEFPATRPWSWECPDAEVAIMSKNDRFVTWDILNEMDVKWDNFDGDEIISHATPDQVCQIISYLYEKTKGESK